MMDPCAYPKRLEVHWVSGTESPELGLLSWALTHSSIVALDAEWKPRVKETDKDHHRTFPKVSLLQLACRLLEFPPEEDSLVFLLDLQTIPLASIYAQLKEMFVSHNVLKLGFRCKQDFTYLSSTFCSHGFQPGFDTVEPFIDISNVYNLLEQRQPGRRISNNAKSLATICEELLGVSISKELQCSDWSQRPLTEEQKTYAAVDAHCLLEIFTIFQLKIKKEGSSEKNDVDVLRSLNSSSNTKAVLENPKADKKKWQVAESLKLQMLLDKLLLNS